MLLLICFIFLKATTLGQSFVDSQSSISLGEPLLHHVELDQFGFYHLLWTPKEEEIVFEVQVKTGGYVGLGFSPNGGMSGADIYIGWIDREGNVVLTDRHGTGDRTPSLDPSQDHRLINGYKNASHTVIRFSRPWKTCDEQHDFELTEDTTRVIWSYDKMLPDPSQSTLPYHDHRGTRSLYLAEPKIHEPKDLDKNLFWDIRAPNVEVPSEMNTLYWCALYKSPDIRRKQQMIGYEPLIDEKGPVPTVHHMLLYECTLENSDEHLEKWVGHKGAQCYERNMPLSWISCSTPIVSWAIGSRGEMLPDNVGFPLGEGHGGSNYFLLEVHYDNPQYKAGIVDNSGLRLFLSTTPREFDAGVITLGHKVEPSMIVPPGAVWPIVGHCTADCTKRIIPEEGINVFSAVLHAHLLGKGITVQHLRDNNELEPLVQDASYDFNYQQARVFKKEKKILPGDHLITTCLYDSTRKKVPTFGGFGTTDEMCLAFLTYYPKLDWSQCHSLPDVNLLFTIFGIQDLYDNSIVMKTLADDDFNSSSINAERDKFLHEMTSQSAAPAGSDSLAFRMVDFFRIVKISEPAELRGKTFYDILMANSTWNDTKLISELRQVATKSPYVSKCFHNGRRVIPGVPKKSKVPYYFEYQPKDDKCHVPSTTGKPLASTQLASAKEVQTVKAQIRLSEEPKTVREKYTANKNEVPKRSDRNGSYSICADSVWCCELLLALVCFFYRP